jgi:hypothetical protein
LGLVWGGGVVRLPGIPNPYGCVLLVAKFAGDLFCE